MKENTRLLISRFSSLARAAVTPSCIFPIETWTRVSVASSETYSKCRYICTGSCPRREPEAVPCQEEVWRRERDLLWPLPRSPSCALGNPILRQSTLVLLSVTARLSRRERRGVNSYATRCLHYHISDAICSRELMHPRYFLPPRISPETYRAH